jgi:hypothetical protein
MAREIPGYGAAPGLRWPGAGMGSNTSLLKNAEILPMAWKIGESA